MSEFNLLDEKWIMVMASEKGDTEEVSLNELFRNAHKYKQLAGETPTQDFAILRFLLAILHTVFTRFKINGDFYEEVSIDDDDVSDFEKALYSTWKLLWERKEFPSVINEYLEKYRYRFYLIDDKYPFFQFPKIGVPDYEYSATLNSVNKLNGRVLEGDPRKPRLFMSQHQKELDYSVAARWLLYANGYSPSKSGNPGKKIKRDSTGVAYLGKLGGIYASGKNLFETLMLNFNLRDSVCMQKPVWEEEPEIENFRAIPDNLAQLFTYPSRQLLLKKNERNQIVQYYLDLAISNFEYVPNLMIEPFTFWREDNNLDVKKWKVKDGIVPMRHDPNKYFWQEMQTFSSIEEEKQKPGIIDWLIKLQEDELVSGLIALNAVGENYIQKDGVVDRQIFDQISENIGLLDKQHNGWLVRIAEEIKQTEKTIKNTALRFGRDIDKIRKIEKNSTEDELKMQVYFSVDENFRKWLIEISPHDEKGKRIREWREILRTIIINCVNNVINDSGKRDYLGFYTEKNRMENIQIAYNRFLNNLKKEMG